MKIMVIGAGAMGTLLTGMLVRDGHELWQLEKNRERVEAVRQGGIRVDTPQGSWQVPLRSITLQAEEAGTAELVIVLVKAYDTAAAIRSALPAISRGTTVLTLQNGLGNVEQISSEVPESQILAGTTAHGATMIAHGHVRHAGIGDTVIGAVSEAGTARAQAVEYVFSRAGLNCRVAEDIQPVMWGKLLVNVGINALTAIMQIQNGRIPNLEPLRRVMKEAVLEAVGVAREMNVSLPFGDPVQKVVEVCDATAENRSSMFQDVLARRKTEIDYINGAVADYGRKAGVPTPVNRILTDLVHAIERISAI